MRCARHQQSGSSPVNAKAHRDLTFICGNKKLELELELELQAVPGDKSGGFCSQPSLS